MYFLSRSWWLTIRLMKCVQSSGNGPDGSPKNDENKELGSGVVGGPGEGRSEEEEVLRVVENSKNAGGCWPNVSMVHSQSQGQLVRWERFLPVNSLKVLLVESDDSTRHVVSALLRNCSYEVTAVSNGIDAWNILKDLDNQIDLILTEAVMSGLSGIGLLSKIMTHKSCRNIPVIMMSCYDSMGIVLKCLSNGAADFLVKPIRKNELKNLWQHVWRRCHSSSGSESGVGNEKSMTAKSAHESDNGTGSDEEEDDSRSYGLQGQDGSDNGSGTQSSWAKRAAEINSPQPQRQSLSDKLADSPDSTCAQVTSPRSEAIASSWVPAPVDECKADHNNKLDLEIGLLQNTQSMPKAPSVKLSMPDTEEKQPSHLDLKTDGRDLEKKLEMDNVKPEGDGTSQAVNLTENMACTFGMPVAVAELPKSRDKSMEDVPKSPSMELDLNKLSDCAEASNVSELNVLRHSELSAFTRYNSYSSMNQGLTGNVGSCSPEHNISESAKKPNSDSTPNQISNNSSNNIDMASTTNRSFVKPDNKTPEKSTLKCSFQTLAFQPTRKGQTSNTEQRQLVAAHDDLSRKSMNETVPQGSLKSKGAPTEANAVNYSVNGSVCGSNHGSNVRNGGIAAVNAEKINRVNDSGNGDGSGSGSGVGKEESRSAQREVALNKFRQKRKERCFERKVRYQSRKKLADQRPRVRGQFVRQGQDNKGEDPDS